MTTEVKYGADPAQEVAKPAARCRSLHVPAAMCEAYHYPKPSAFSRGMEVDLGAVTMVFVSGTASVGPDGSTLHRGNFKAQARRAFENARSVLASAGADWHDVVKATFYLTAIGAHYAAFNEVRSAFYREMGLIVYPASTCVEAALCREDLLVEMELVAIVPNDRRKTEEEGLR
jgi:enamine deaminase RidA (YjgF/YER057c/UK114 family)